MSGLQLMPSGVQQKLALMNAAPDLRDALEAFLPPARQMRDGFVRQLISGENLTVGDRLMNTHLVSLAAVWNDRIDAAEKAIRSSKGGAR